MMLPVNFYDIIILCIEKKCNYLGEEMHMKILYLEWNSYCNEDMKEGFEKEGHEVEVCPFFEGIRIKQEEAEKYLQPRLSEKQYDFVFSFNYIPIVSNICKEFDAPYVSWVYDSPYIHAYSYTVLNSCNYIFLFDYAVYQELHDAGIQTVYYLPLAVNPERVLRLKNSPDRIQRYSADISFVGSLYNEPKHRLYDKFQDMAPYAKGYLDAIIDAQKKVYGYNFLSELLDDSILEELQRVYPTDPNASSVMKPRDIYADYVLARQVTSLERQEIIALLGQRMSGYDIKLFTPNKQSVIEGVKNCGQVDYNDEMPYVFLNSKINLNISLRSIKTGIPLRVFDIMGSRGFLLTNYQEEMMQYFEAGVDFMLYENYEDLLSKSEYYLTHEKERKEIAENGYQNVCANHTITHRIREMLEVVQNGRTTD